MIIINNFDNYFELRRKISMSSSENKNKICEAIKKYRLMKRLTAAELSKRTGIAASNLSAIESGERVPKLDMCNKIACALGADPLEICGLELTKEDEKRLLMKLLTKYADSISIDTDSLELKSVAVLPVDFADFAMRYEEHVERVKFAVQDIAETDPRFELVKANAEDEFKYWMDMYPVYDAVVTAKNKALQGEYPSSDDTKIEKARSQGDIDFEMIDIWSTIIQEEMNPDFWSFQSEYIIPNRNETWRTKHTKKVD